VTQAVGSSQNYPSMRYLMNILSCSVLAKHVQAPAGIAHHTGEVKASRPPLLGVDLGYNYKAMEVRGREFEHSLSTAARKITVTA
jgi:hypothetical protein